MVFFDVSSSAFFSRLYVMNPFMKKIRQNAANPSPPVHLFSNAQSIIMSAMITPNIPIKIMGAMAFFIKCLFFINILISRLVWGYHFS